MSETAESVLPNVESEDSLEEALQKRIEAGGRKAAATMAAIALAMGVALGAKLCTDNTYRNQLKRDMYAASVNCKITQLDPEPERVESLSDQTVEKIQSLLSYTGLVPSDSEEGSERKDEVLKRDYRITGKVAIETTNIPRGADAQLELLVSTIPQLRQDVTASWEAPFAADRPIFYREESPAEAIQARLSLEKDGVIVQRVADCGSVTVDDNGVARER